MAPALGPLGNLHYMRRFFFFACAIASIAFLANTFLGLGIALRAKALVGYSMSGVGALLVLTLMLSTRDIMATRDMLHRSIRPFWFAALLLGLYLSYLASCSHIVLSRELFDTTPIEWKIVKDGGFSQQLAVWSCILFLTASPVAVSYLIRRINLDENGQEAE